MCNVNLLQWQFLTRDEGERDTLNDPSWTQDEGTKWNNCTACTCTCILFSYCYLSTCTCTCIMYLFISVCVCLCAEPVASVVDSWARGLVHHTSSTNLESSSMAADPPLIIRDLPPSPADNEGERPAREPSRPATTASRLESSVGYTLPSASRKKVYTIHVHVRFSDSILHSCLLKHNIIAESMHRIYNAILHASIKNTCPAFTLPRLPSVPDQ